METETHPDGINYKNKTTMKNYYIMVVATTIALCSCSNEKDIILDENNSTASVFTATIENATRATLQGQTPTWEEYDQISINGKIYEAQEAGSSVSFSAIGEAAEGSTYFAYFPANLYDGATATLPASYTYEEGKFNMPMYAENSTTDLNFKNICAVLAISISNEDINQIVSIKVVSDQQMNGAFTCNADGTLAFSSPSSDLADRTINLNCSSAIEMTSSAKIFYIAIPAQNYNFLNIYLSSDGTTYKEAMGTKSASGLGNIYRNKIYSIDYAKNAVQLWSSGPYFAFVNVGATISDYKNVTTSATETIGGRYAWSLPTNYWGGNWVTPTAAQLWVMNNRESDNTRDLDTPVTNWIYCDGGLNQYETGCTLVGYKVQGCTTGYEGNSIFFPNNDGTFGRYWTCTPEDPGWAFAMHLRPKFDGHGVSASYNDGAYAIRPILNN